MNKLQAVKRFEAIPLPNTVRDAFMRLKKDWSYVSHKRHNLTPVEAKAAADIPLILDSHNHGFYIGNYFPDSLGVRLQKLLAWGKPKKRIYSEEFIIASLDYIFAHLKPGEKAYFVVAGSVGEMLNGKENVDTALSIEDEIELIYRLAQSRFKKGKESIEVVDLSKDPLHKDLFGALQGAQFKDENGLLQLDIDKALSTKEPMQITKDSSSLEIARCLYAACADKKFMNIIKHAVPGLLKDDESAEDENEEKQDQKRQAKDFYAVVEVANRLREVLSGRYIHGGANRQAIYDQIIAAIIKGKEGPYRNIKQLHGLMEACKGLHFETLHVDTDHNYHQFVSTRTRARLRLALGVVLGGAVLLGVHQKGRYDERREQERIEERVNEKLRKELRDVTFYIEQCYKWPSDEKYNVKNFHDVVNRMTEQLDIRYKLVPAVSEDLKPLIREFLLRKKSKLNSYYCDNALLIQAVDQFVSEQIIYFEDKDIDINLPYSDLLPYLDKLRAALTSEEKVEIKPGFLSNSSLKRLGNFSCSNYAWKLDFEFVLYTDADGHSMILARHKDFVDKPYTSFQAKEAAREFINSMKKYNNLPLHEHEDLLYAVYDQGSINFNPSMLVVDVEPAIRFEKIFKYQDVLKEFEYEVAIYSHWDQEKEVSSRNIVARLPGEKHYTTARAKEVAKLYFKSQRSHWSLAARGDD